MIVKTCYFDFMRRNVIKSALHLIGCGAITIFFLNGLPANASDQISVGTVNGENIWLDEVISAAQRLPEEYQQQPLENYFAQLVSDIIDSRLAAQAARDAAHDKKPKIAEAMEMAANIVLAESWIDEKARAEITEAAIKNAYDKFVADTASREQITASHILLETESEANAIITALQNGNDFASLAKEKSTGPSGPNGGLLGTFPRGQMVPAFENAAFGLEAGAFSEVPVQTQFGWHVIKVDAKEISPAPSLEEMRGQLTNNLWMQTQGRIREELRASQDIQLRSITDIKNEATNTAQ